MYAAQQKKGCSTPDLDVPIAVPKLNLAERKPIFTSVEENGAYLGKNGNSPKGPSKTLIPELLPAMAIPNA
ncbi:hypothetical protein TNCV_1365881 [Trichonephila clavipes]|nr:hypothetical protein TNCV_1365881 [Trichonephila clavipes]